jgi:hypothetical protein
VNKVNLLEMDASDTLDVIHYFFEEDNTKHSTGEHAEASSKFRTNFYKMYNVDYAYKYEGGGGRGNADGRRYIDPATNDFDNDVTPVDLSSLPLKPYTPATDFNPVSNMPFGDALDGPVGG